MKQFKGTISKWTIHSVPEYRDKYSANLGLIITGRISGHPTFQDGPFQSSLVVSITKVDNGWDVETLNSFYRLQFDAEEVPDA